MTTNKSQKKNEQMVIKANIEMICSGSLADVSYENLLILIGQMLMRQMKMPVTVTLLGRMIKKKVWGSRDTAPF